MNGTAQDRWTIPELAAALDRVAHRAPIVTLAASVLRETRPGECQDQVADDIDEHGYMIARKFGAYDDAAVCGDAAEVLRTLAKRPAPSPSMIVEELQAWATDPEDEPVSVEGIESGTFRTIGSSCIDGVAVTEHEPE
jgi:hypothetical protein